MKKIYKSLKLYKFLNFMQIIWILIFISGIYKEKTIISIISVIFIMLLQFKKNICDPNDKAFELKIEKKEK